MKPKEFIENRDNGYIAGDYTPSEVYELLSEYAQQEAIAFAEWLVETNYAEKETWGKHENSAPPSIQELYSLFKQNNHDI